MTSASNAHCQHVVGDGIAVRRVVEEDVQDGRVVGRVIKCFDAAGCCIRTDRESVKPPVPDPSFFESLKELSDNDQEKDASWMAADHAAKIAMVEHNEEKFEVKRSLVIGNWEVVWVYFPDCPNGNKVMVYRTDQDAVVRLLPSKRQRINPHFGRHDSPFARFEPTERGWHAALKIAEMFRNGV